ncbi:unnamed protein product [Penicillium salamii]|uniref:Uncharacterized protein n=1 Tax=Penicillium salamii TaxID=1612424 RepID=A0A9W4JWE5_9EURO|nr:unnamed protein product [Penicillium salamii]CAG8027741.1 unnamed protein product [Penicillium salamii]CAG8062707.1 unnamed protein product [Penicillium salamii]CAG8080347.1 unnamed protein product [Penicillium salamii]CAG8187163.1 unnamed protein product [Penicillium salamii]
MRIHIELKSASSEFIEFHLLNIPIRRDRHPEPLGSTSANLSVLFDINLGAHSYSLPLLSVVQDPEFQIFGT